MWNGTMFVDLDWPLNASSLLSASAELLVLMPERHSHCIKKERERRSRAFPSDWNPDFMYLYMLRHNSLKMLLMHLCRLNLGQLASLSRDFSNRKMEEHRLNIICTFNCHSIKSSLNELSELCEHSDLVLLQEHWLLPFEIGCLNTVHKDFFIYW